KIDVDLIIWSRIFVISKKIFLSIWSLFPALTPSSPLIIPSTSLFSISFNSFKEFDIPHFLKDLIITSSEMLSHDHFTHPQTSLNLARRRFSPTPPFAIHRCHSLRRLSLNSLFIATSRG